MSRQVTLGILSPYFGGEYLGKIVAQLFQSARSYNVRMVAVRTGGMGKFDLPVGLSHVDGWVILLNAISRDYLARLVATGKPIVSVAYDFDEPNVVLVESDNEGSTAIAMSQLIQAGHSHIAYVGHVTEYDIQRRVAGYRRALAEHQLPYRPEYVFDIDDYGQVGGSLAAQRILERKLPVTAIMTGTDRNAAGLIVRFQEAGVRIPEDIAVVGYDNTYVAITSNPPLASIDQNLDQLAERVVTVLLEQIRNDCRRGGRETVDNTFVPRESCGLPLTSASFEWHQAGHEMLADLTTNYEISKHLVTANAESIQSLMKLLVPYVEWRCIGMWNDPLREPENVVIRDVHSYKDGVTVAPEIHCNVMAFPPLNEIGKAEHFDAEHFICVLPVISSKKRLRLMAISGLMGTAHRLAGTVQYVDLLAPAFERTALDEELAAYQAGLEEMVKKRTTELSQKTAELIAAKERADAANRSKTAFLANMSHELRSPLNAILGFAGILARESKLSREEMQDDLDIILKNSEHLYELINQVLDLSKIESGDSSLYETDFDLYALLEEIETMFLSAAKRKCLQLIVENESDVPRYLRADAVKLRQVLINLVGNALKFTREGGVILRVSQDKRNDNQCGGYCLSFGVIDSGVGIAAEELDKLGRAFVQAHAGRQSLEGNGLGLAISRNFVQLMGGELRISSDLGLGTAITFILPVRAAAADNMSAPATKTKSRVLALAPNQSSFRILVVDDRQESRQLLIRLLSPLGFDLREARNGHEALSIWEGWEPHLIWMDMRMPIMDGREATRYIKSKPKGQSTIIIALTASSFEEDREQLLSLGCSDFLRKPFREDMLFEMMRKHLNLELVYEEVASSSTIRTLDRASLTTVPSELKNQLKQALRCLDDDGIEKTVMEIHKHNPTLADTLMGMVKNYEHRQIITLLKEGQEQ